MNKFEDLSIFNNIDQKTRYRAIQLAIARSNVYKQPMVVMKLLGTFLVTFIVSIVLLGSFSWSLIASTAMLVGLNRIVLSSDFERHVKPLLASCLHDVRKFPDIRK